MTEGDFYSLAGLWVDEKDGTLYEVQPQEREKPDDADLVLYRQVWKLDGNDRKETWVRQQDFALDPRTLTLTEFLGRHAWIGSVSSDFNVIRYHMTWDGKPRPFETVLRKR